MKANFIVSVNRRAWIPGARRLFVAEPYVQYVLERDGELALYDEVATAPPLWPTREEFSRAHEFVDAKYRAYVPIFARRLNQLHRRQYPERFWQKCFSLALLRYVALAYQVFEIAERFLDPDAHDCRVLAPQSYTTPRDFNDHRDLLQYTAFGQEQLFSIYTDVFHRGRFATYDDAFDWTWNRRANIRSVRGILSRLASRDGLRRLGRRVTDKLLAWHFAGKQPDGPTVGILNCFFAPWHQRALIVRSNGRILPLRLSTAFEAVGPIDMVRRRVLAAVEAHADRFDRFFFRTVEHCFPRELLEDFEPIELDYRELASRHRNLTHVVSETWIGDTYTSIATAILQQHGVKHVYNEHNYLSHQMLHSNKTYLAPLVDVFATLGWEDRRLPNVVRGASLFSFVERRKPGRRHGILFVAGLPMVRLPEFNLSYGEAGAARAFQYLEFNRRFFHALSNRTIQRIVFRPYPADRWPVAAVRSPMIHYEQDPARYERPGGRFERIDRTSENSRRLIPRSRLVIVDYLSTAYLEALLADVPTVVLWNRDNYILRPDYSDFYDELIHAGICQTDPVQAAALVEAIADQPESWWRSEPVQQARSAFLARNIAPSEVMLEFLLGLAGEPPAARLRNGRGA